MPDWPARGFEEARVAIDPAPLRTPARDAIALWEPPAAAARSGRCDRPGLPSRLLEPALGDLPARLLALLDVLDPQLAPHAGGPLELHLAVVDDLEVVAPRVEEVEAAPREHAQALALDRRAGQFEVVDDQADVALAVGRLRPALREGDEGRPCR
jgi:hypothetical protein